MLSLKIFIMSNPIFDTILKREPICVFRSSFCCCISDSVAAQSDSPAKSDG